MAKPRPSNTGSAASGSGSASTATSNSKSKTKSEDKPLSTTDTGFEQQFRENGYVGPLSAEALRNPPVDLEEIEAYLNKSRSSESPTSSQHECFIIGVGVASSERDVESLYGNSVLKPTNRNLELARMGYAAKIDKQWVDFDKNVDFNEKLSAPKPDLTEGYLHKAFPSGILKKMGGAATLTKDNPDFVAFPHFVGEFKAVGKDMKRGTLQAGYDGAAMVYARNKVLAHIGQPDPDNHASPLTLIVDGLNWAIFAHYTHTKDGKNDVEYYQVCYIPRFVPPSVWNRTCSC